MPADPDWQIEIRQDLRLSPASTGILRDLLINAVVSPNRFNDLLQFRLNKPPLYHYAAMNDPYPDAVANVIRTANAEIWWRDLLREARNMVPADPLLLTFAEQASMAPTLVSRRGNQQSIVRSNPELELKIRAANTSFDILTWRMRLGEIESRVCRIEYPETDPRGTGFLVAPDLVLTNYHVMEPVLQNPGLAQDVRLRFDYKVQANGVSVSQGKAYMLATDWLMDDSRYSPHDSEVNPTGLPGPEELDYALVRVQGRPGDDPVGGDTNDPAPTKRGWIALTDRQHDFRTQPALYIVQHPDGKPMQVTIDSEAILSVNENGTRVRYSTETEPGSSGSPCFGADWGCVALHHLGDPKYWKLATKPEFNQGIPVAAIAQLLNARGKGDLLTAR